MAHKYHCYLFAVHLLSTGQDNMQQIEHFVHVTEPDLALYTIHDNASTWTVNPCTATASPNFAVSQYFCLNEAWMTECDAKFDRQLAAQEPAPHVPSST